MQKWMDSVAGQTFLNYAYSWGAAIVILGTLFKLTYLPGADIMLFIGMGTEVFVFFISAFDRPFDKSTIDMTLDNHMSDDITITGETPAAQPAAQPVVIGGGSTVATTQSSDAAPTGNIAGGTIIIGGGSINTAPSYSAPVTFESPEMEAATEEANTEVATPVTVAETAEIKAPRITTPAPAVSQATAEAMEDATTTYVSRLNELNETFEKVAALSARLATDSEEMENLNRTLTGISRVYEMQLKSASQQITTQDEINEQTRKMAQQIQELNSIYARMIEAMTTNMPRVNG